MTPLTLRFAVPFLPPSVNHYKHPRRGGGWFRSVEAMSFVDAVCIFSGKFKVTGNFYDVELTFHLGPNKKNLSSNDLDNFLKVALDALGRAQVIKNDGRILDLHVHKRFVSTDREERTEFSIGGKLLDEDQVFSGRVLQTAPGSHSTQGSEAGEPDPSQVRHALALPEKGRSDA